jgi:hypothetical protein
MMFILSSRGAVERRCPLIAFAVLVRLRTAVGWSRFTFMMTTASLLLLYLFDRRQNLELFIPCPRRPERLTIFLVT